MGDHTYSSRSADAAGRAAAILANHAVSAQLHPPSHAQNRDKLDAIANELLIKETLDEAEVYKIAGIERPVQDDFHSESVGTSAD